MIKVTVMYPHTPGARFDHDYYRDTHMPMVQDKLGPACLRYTVDKGLSGGAPGSPPPYVGTCSLFFHSVEDFQAAFAPQSQAILGDIPNYTDLQPVMMVSEAVVA